VVGKMGTALYLVEGETWSAGKMKGAGIFFLWNSLLGKKKARGRKPQAREEGRYFMVSPYRWGG